VPRGLRHQARLGEQWQRWLDDLPRLATEVVADWQLRPDGRPLHGFCSLVLPVRTTGGRPAVLKLGLPDDDTAQEHLALRHWAGRGAVELLRADPGRRALLLERLHPEDLHGVEVLAACEIVAGLYRRLHLPAPASLVTLPARVDAWLDALAGLARDAPLPRRFVEQALGHGRDLVADKGSSGVLVHGDLHYGNVLAADREPWLVIDPKPLSGDPHYEVAPLLWNRWDEVVASGDVRTAVRRRFHTVVDAAGLDEDRARAWVVVREVLNAQWALADAERAGRAPGVPEREVVTRAVSVVKAVGE
jgi:streptomycin 6-kinase